MASTAPTRHGATWGRANLRLAAWTGDLNASALLTSTKRTTRALGVACARALGAGCDAAR